MRAELERSAGLPAGGGQTRGSLIERPAELVYLAEELFLRLFCLTLVLTLVGCALSLVFGAIESRAPFPLTCAIAAVVAAVALAALHRPRSWYVWLRHDRLRQITPALLASAVVLWNGPDSPSWWVALPLLWVVAAVSSTELSIAAAVVTSGAYLAGTLLGGEAVLHSGEAGVLAAAVALPGNILVGRLVAEVFARFILRLDQLQREHEEHAPTVRLGYVGATHEAPAADRPPSGTRPGRRDGTIRLTARELEVAMLVREGLHLGEIGEALGISTRQVERLLGSARSHTNSATTSQLIANLVMAGTIP